MRRTKMVNTIGPASNSLENLRKIIAAGADVLRLNMSHGTPAEKAAMVKDIREIAKQEGRVVAVLADLQGPKIRIACFKNEEVQLEQGADFALNAELGRNDGDEHQVGIDYRNLVNDVASGDTLLLDDGRIVLVVERVEGSKICCKVKVGGKLSDHKGINRLGGGLSANALTDKDREDLRLSVAADVDYIGVSFVRSDADVLEAKRLIAELGGRARVISKIERVEAIEPETLNKIVQASDAIMVARGDLGVEIGEAYVPAAQRLIIDSARRYHRPVITATQMLETMIHSVQPTRAEVSDIANAILDGTDAVMTSAETAAGDHPILVAQTMAHVCETVDEGLCDDASKVADCAARSRNCCGSRPEHTDCGTVNDCGCTTEAVVRCAVKMARCIKAKALVVFTHSGEMAFRLSAHNRVIPLVAFTDCERTWSSMALSRNVQPILMDCACCAQQEGSKECSAEASDCCCCKESGCVNCRCWIKTLLDKGIVRTGDKLVVVGGCCCGDNAKEERADALRVVTI